jgi:hypothetical protein
MKKCKLIACRESSDTIICRCYRCCSRPRPPTATHASYTHATAWLVAVACTSEQLVP